MTVTATTAVTMDGEMKYYSDGDKTLLHDDDDEFFEDDLTIYWAVQRFKWSLFCWNF